MSWWRNQIGNQKAPQHKWKWKYNTTNYTKCGKSSSKEGSLEGYHPSTHQKKKNNNNNKKKLDKEEQINPKATRRKKIIKSE